MDTQTITLELPDPLYRFATEVAQATNRPVAEIIQESLARALPPLDDVPSDEFAEFARLSTLDDGALWQVASTELSTEEQTELSDLLDAQNARALTSDEHARLLALMELYGRALVRKSHAWLLLARRGYRVPVQNPGRTVE